jgi:hypothetical protein
MPGLVNRRCGQGESVDVPGFAKPCVRDWVGHARRAFPADRGWQDVEEGIKREEFT